MADELTHAEKSAVKWHILESWYLRKRNDPNKNAQDLWFDFVTFYEGLRDG